MHNIGLLLLVSIDSEPNRMFPLIQHFMPYNTVGSILQYYRNIKARAPFGYQRLLAAVSLWALKKRAATGRPSSFSSANFRVLKQSLKTGGPTTVCLRFCLKRRNTNLWIPMVGLGIS